MKTEVYRLILIGMSGVGKSYYGYKVSQFSGIPFYDTDDLLEKRYAESAARMIEKYGEVKFRDFEGQVFSDCLRKDELILSTGGGIVVRDVNRELLKQEKRVIYLKASPLTLAKQVASDNISRPLLDYTNLEESISSLLKYRERWYRECADIVMDTDLLREEEILARILDLLV